MSLSVVLLDLLINIFVSVNSQRPTDDLVTNLPGLYFKTNYNMYSGYLSLSNGHNYHYWLTESQNDPDNDPVVIWLNGGPGCSSLVGLLQELGPIHVYPNGTLYPNEYSWNTLANILFLESPICVGFSYQNGLSNCTMNDTTTADDNYEAILKFLDKFPVYTDNDWYVTGESYGGVYVPMLTERILSGQANINLKGFAVGNGVSYAPFIKNGRYWYFYHHGMISEQVWSRMQTNCCTAPYNRDSCPFNEPPNQLCQEAVNEANNNCCDGVNLYNIYGPCYHYDDGNDYDYYFPKQRYQVTMTMNGFFDDLNIKYDDDNDNFKDSDDCLDDRGVNIYLNRLDVRQALHIPDILNNMIWNDCSDKTSNPSLNYTGSFSADLRPTYNAIFELDDNIHATIYNGDTDAICCFLSDEWFVDNMNVSITNKWREWFIDNIDQGRQVGGWTQDYDRGGGLHFVTIRGSGHLVPLYAPQKALKLFKYFLANQDL